LFWEYRFELFGSGSIKNDDKLIQEGVESLSEAGLRQACRDWGLLGLHSVEEMRQQVNNKCLNGICALELNSEIFNIVLIYYSFANFCELDTAYNRYFQKSEPLSSHFYNFQNLYPLIISTLRTFILNFFSNQFYPI
jgi:hypothetical protein